MCKLVFLICTLVAASAIDNSYRLDDVCVSQSAALKCKWRGPGIYASETVDFNVTRVIFGRFDNSELNITNLPNVNLLMYESSPYDNASVCHHITKLPYKRHITVSDGTTHVCPPTAQTPGSTPTPTTRRSTPTTRRSTPATRQSTPVTRRLTTTTRQPTTTTRRPTTTTRRPTTTTRRPTTTTRRSTPTARQSTPVTRRSISTNLPASIVSKPEQPSARSTEIAAGFESTSSTHPSVPPTYISTPTTHRLTPPAHRPAHRTHLWTLPTQAPALEELQEAVIGVSTGCGVTGSGLIVSLILYCRLKRRRRENHELLSLHNISTDSTPFSSPLRTTPLTSPDSRSSSEPILHSTPSSQDPPQRYNTRSQARKNLFDIVVV